MKRIIPLFVILVAALSTVLYLEIREQETAATRASGGSGTVEGTEVDIVARLPARITAIHAAEGDQVSAGALLVELDCAEPLAASQQAEAAVAAARAAVAAARVGVPLAEQGVKAAQAQTAAAEAAARAARTQRAGVSVQRGAAKRAAARIEQLAASGGASDQDLDQAQTQAAALGKQIQTLAASASAASKQAEAVAEGEGAASLRVQLAQAQVAAAQSQIAVAEAAVARARVAVAECRITAPRAGVVTLRSYEPGEVVMPGSRVLTLVDLAEVTATFYLPNAELAAAAPGRQVEVVADAMPGRTFTGQIRRVGAQAEFTPRNVQTRADRDRLVYAVDVVVPNPDGALRPGMPVEIVIANTEQR